MSFVNPYNFVTLETSSDNGEHRKQKRNIPVNETLSGERLYTGKLECKLTTKTPLFIPNTSNDHTFVEKELEVLKEYNRLNTRKQIVDTKENRSKSYDFFSYNDQEKGNTRDITPIIPGSSIRGVVRSVYETITNSCMSTCGGRETPLYRRSTVARKKYGIIKGDTLYRAEKLRVRSSHIPYSGRYANSCDIITNGKTGDELKVDKNTKIIYTTKKRSHNTELHFAENIGSGNSTGYYLRGEKFGENKHFDAIMVPCLGENGQWIKVQELVQKDFDRLETVLRLYQDREDDNIGVNQTKRHAYKDYFGKDRRLDRTKVLPVYYSTLPTPKGDKLYISPACMTKEVFDRSISDILKSMGDFEACSNVNNLCEACHLFGMVGQNSDARSSRVQFRDAKPLEIDNYLGEVTTMAVLGSPKQSATEFYMQDPDNNSDTFNYDYMTRSRRLTWIKKVNLRGRKYYWHHKWDENYPKTNEAEDKPKHFQIGRPVIPEKTFGFTVAFERLSFSELQKLVYAIQLQDGHAHKIGHGKPIGYGSVQIDVDSELSKVYTLTKDMKLTDSLLPEEIFTYCYNNAEFLELTNIVISKNNISYPVGTERTVTVNGVEHSKSDTFRWFTLNREAVGHPYNATSNPKTAYVLPRANADDVSLPKIEKTITETEIIMSDGRKRTSRSRSITSGNGSNRDEVWNWYNHE